MPNISPSKWSCNIAYYEFLANQLFHFICSINAPHVSTGLQVSTHVLRTYHSNSTWHVCNWVIDKFVWHTPLPIEIILESYLKLSFCASEQVSVILVTSCRLSLGLVINGVPIYVFTHPITLVIFWQVPGKYRIIWQVNAQFEFLVSFFRSFAIPLQLVIVNMSGTPIQVICI